MALLSQLIDHAPVFPPASLPLPDALAEDARARASAASFMLGRFVCPASGLDRLPRVGRGVSVVLNASFRPRDDVEAVETTARDGLDELPRLAREVYVEVPLDDGLERRLDELAVRGLGAKVRCGGASVPDASALGGFVRACGERGIPFKATAGGLPSLGSVMLVALLLGFLRRRRPSCGKSMILSRASREWPRGVWAGYPTPKAFPSRH